MNSAVRCIILLACVAICCSAANIPNCQCAATTYVHPLQIIGVKTYPPRPYCRRHEVIVTLKDKSTQCLDPEHPLTQRIVERAEKQRAKMNATRTKATTVPATPPATVLATEVSTSL